MRSGLKATDSYDPIEEIRQVTALMADAKARFEASDRVHAELRAECQRLAASLVDALQRIAALEAQREAAATAIEQLRAFDLAELQRKARRKADTGEVESDPPERRLTRRQRVGLLTAAGAALTWLGKVAWPWILALVTHGPKAPPTLPGGS